MKKYFTICMIILYVNLYSQHQNDNWYFGTWAAVNFTSGSPVAVATNTMVSSEGNATISDSLGNLLFYTNGISVWNRNNVPMPNGSGLASDPIAAQAALIIPKPGSNTLYYLFTMNTWEYSPTDLRYSIIDITLNGGLGDVTATKNILVNNNAREQLTAVPHSNGTDFWIIIHEGLNHHFNAYQLSALGLNTTPIVSDLGMDYTGSNRFGYLRSSHNCTKLASTLGSNSTANETVQIYDFNATTGVVSNPITVATFSMIPQAYSCEFSPDDSKLYVTNNRTSSDETKIFQFDLNAANISSTIIDIANGISGAKSGLASAVDGKIYVGMAGSNYLSTINNPNLLGLNCNYQNNVVNLGFKYCAAGLPNNVKYNCQTIQSVEDRNAWLGKINIFPNPIKETVTISRENSPDELYLHIYNSIGINIYSTVLTTENFNLNCGQFASGLYFFKIQNDQKVLVQKVIIE